MNDHNLDDLIIDNIDPKNSKTKSFLTIIALAIVVLIVAIILTKIILKDPNAELAIIEDNTELISPELTLQESTALSTTKKEEQKEVKPTSLTLDSVKKALTSTVLSPNVEKVTQTKEEIVEAVKPTVKETITPSEMKPKVVEITDEFSQTKVVQKESKPEVKEPAVKEKVITKPKEVATSSTSLSGYFIQVGSFSKMPSSRFLSVISNSGFKYKITSASSKGTKKLLIGPYSSRSQVDTALVRVKDRINKSAFVVKK